MAPWNRKKAFRPKGIPSLACDCLRDGTLDVDTATGCPSGSKGAIRHRADRDGYRMFTLSREVARGGKLYREGQKRRRRRQQTVMVHRLVVMKALAVERAAFAGDVDQWRDFVADLPHTVDIDHENRERDDNRYSNLRLRQPLPNRQRYTMTDDEYAAALAEEAEAFAGAWEDF